MKTNKNNKVKIIITIVIILALIGAGIFCYYYFKNKNNKPTSDISITYTDGDYSCVLATSGVNDYNASKMVAIYKMTLNDNKISNLQYIINLTFSDVDSYTNILNSTDLDGMTISYYNASNLSIELTKDVTTDLSYKDFINSEELSNYYCNIDSNNTSESTDDDTEYKCINGDNVAYVTVDDTNFVTSMYLGTKNVYTSSTLYNQDKNNYLNNQSETIKYLFDDQGMRIESLKYTIFYGDSPTFDDLKSNYLTGYTCSLN